MRVVDSEGRRWEVEELEVPFARRVLEGSTVVSIIGDFGNCLGCSSRFDVYN